MILHLISDEKVMHRTIKLFDEFANENNIYICFTKKRNYKYIQEEDPVIKYDSSESNNIDYSKINTVIIHYLNNAKIRFIYKHNLQNKTVLWIVWGSDLYNFLYKRGRYELYSDENSYPMNHLNYSNNVIYDLFKRNKSLAIFLSKVITKFYSIYTDYYRTYFFCNYLNYVTCGEQALKLIENGHKLHKFKGRLEYCYYPIEETLGQLVGKWCSGNNIMIGNSAQATNNHEYVLKYLKQIDTSNYTVTVPLSYGGDKEYVEIISSKFSQLPNANCLFKFIPLEDYNKLLLSSTICIYGHYREEAWGNILISLYLGAKIYLSKKNPLYSKCYSIGFKVFELERIADTFYLLLKPQEKQNNRFLAMQHYSKEECIECIRRISDAHLE